MPLLVSFVIVPELDTPAPPVALAAPAVAAPPLIVPPMLLVRLLRSSLPENLRFVSKALTADTAQEDPCPGRRNLQDQGADRARSDQGACGRRLARGVADAGYGADGAFRSGVTAMGLPYVVGVQSTLSVWPPDTEPLPPKPWSGRGRPPSRVRRDGEHAPVPAKTLAMGLPEEAWRIVRWREGSNETLSSRFAAVRIRPASRDWKLAAPHPLEWLLIEWPEGEKSRQNTGFRPCPKTRPSTSSSTRPNCAGESSATTRN